MKRTHFLFLTITALTGFATLAWPLAAQSLAPVKTSSIDYNFDTAALNRSNQGLFTSYSDMLDKVTPGVVGVYPSSKLNPDAIQAPAPAQGSGTGRRGGGGGRRGNNPAQPLPPNKPDWSANSTDYWVMGVGSGCIISADGYILTNHHVIADNVLTLGYGRSVTVKVDAVLIKLPDGREYPATIIGSDEATDLALLKIDAKNLPTIKMADSDKLRVGDIVFAIGNPMDVGLTVTHGIISAMGRSEVSSSDDPSDSKVHFESFIQTDASINEGNSGGPLVDAEGRLIGLDSEILSSDAGGSIGIGFAVPSNLARHVADDLIKDGKVSHGVLGVGSQEIDHNLAQVMGIPNTHGAIVTTVDDRSPAAKTGLQRYDVVVKVNDNEVDSPGKLRYLVAMADPGTAVNLTILRDGKPKVFNVVLADRDKLYPDYAGTANDAAPAPAPVPIVPAHNNGELLTGVSLFSLTADMRDTQDVPADVNGLIVSDIASNSPYFNLFRKDTVIMEVNKKPVTTLEDLKAQLKPGELNMFYIRVPASSPSGFGGQTRGAPAAVIDAHTELVTEAVLKND
jgi:serine protease Do/serine protease DegQ